MKIHKLIILIRLYLVVLFVTVAANPISTLQEQKLFESKDKFQGDIILTKDQEENFFSPPGKGRTGLTAENYRWLKNSDGFILLSYTIKESAGFSKNFI